MSGLLGAMGADAEGFDAIAADEIMAGVAEGFEQAEAMLGVPLPQVSMDTRTLLDAMLADLRQHRRSRPLGQQLPGPARR